MFPPLRIGEKKEETKQQEPDEEELEEGEEDENSGGEDEEERPSRRSTRVSEGSEGEDSTHSGGLSPVSISAANSTPNSAAPTPTRNLYAKQTRLAPFDESLEDSECCYQRFGLSSSLIVCVW